MGAFEIRTALARPAAVVWAHASTLAGVNAELRPWFRMSVPGPLRGRSIDEAPAGQPLGRSWLLLLGVVPVEYDEITLEVVEPFGFIETSSMLMQRVWRHERRVIPHEGGCTVLDRVSWEPRRGVPALPMRSIVPALFRHRHRNLVRLFGAAD